MKQETIDKFVPPYNKESRKKIIEKIKREVNDEGSCRVGWAAEQVLKSPQQNHVHDKLAGIITKNSRYIKERNDLFPKDWNIVTNPSYSLVIIQRIGIIATLIFSVAAIIIQIINLQITKSSRDSQKELQEKVKETQAQVQHLIQITQPTNQRPLSK
jgi:hypothetical protein